MKMKIGVGLAALSALAAEGKDFNREELNAMLDKLAASPEPKVRRGPTAMCYEMAMPERKSFDYLCRKCGMRTHYPENYEGLGEELAFYRDGAAKLRGMGLGIALDESALCRHCTTLKALDIPTSGVIISEPKRTVDNKWWLKRFGLRIGDSVTVKEWGRRQCSVLPRNIEYWIPEKYIDKEGRVTVDGVNVRYAPIVKGDGAFVAKRGDVLQRLDAQPQDPEGWVRVEAPLRIKMISPNSYYVDSDMIGKRGYDEGEDTHLKRIGSLAWIINGKRTVVDRGDVELLEKFMKGEVYLRDGSDGDSVSMKSQLPRLRELLGEPKK